LQFLKALSEHEIESIDDLEHIHQMYQVLGMPKADAEKIAHDAPKKELRDFLSWLNKHGPPPGTLPDTSDYSYLLPKLHAADKWTIEEVSELEATDAEGLGISEEEVELLSDKADEYTSFLFSEDFLKTVVPFSQGPGQLLWETVEKYRDALIAEHVTTYLEIHVLSASDIPAIDPEHLKLMQDDPRVIASALKDEL
jgi:hypothetical protein